MTPKVRRDDAELLREQRQDLCPGERQPPPHLVRRSAEPVQENDRLAVPFVEVMDLDTGGVEGAVAGGEDAVRE